MRADQSSTAPDPTESLVADSRARALRALLRVPSLRRLWGAHLTSATADALALFVLVLLALQAADASEPFGGGYRGAAVAISVVFAVRVLATVVFGAVLLGPLGSLLSGTGKVDRRWTMIGADVLRTVLLIVAPLWIDWTPDSAITWILVTVFVSAAAERVWTVAKDSAAPAMLPAPPPEGAAIRPLPDQAGALRRLSLRTAYLALPIGAAALLVTAWLSRALAAGLDWFDGHPDALSSYLAAGLFAASVSVLFLMELPDGGARVHSPLEGLRRPRTGAGEGPDRGRTGAIPLLVGACAAVAAAIAAAVALTVMQAFEAYDIDRRVAYGLLLLAVVGGPAIGVRWAPRVLPALSRRRLLALATGVCGLGLLLVGLVADAATGVLCALLASVAAGVAGATGHTLLEQETEEARRQRVLDHVHAVARLAIALALVCAPLLAGAIGQHRLEAGDLVFAHGGAAFTYMLAGALLLPVAVLVLVRTDDRQGVPLRQDLVQALRGGATGPADGTAANGFFIAVEGGDGAGKSTQVEAVAQWIRDKGHEVVVTREPGSTSVGQRLRSILLDVASAGISPRAEALLYAADRAEHVDSVVRPALERGAVVITDRYVDSSVAYQGAGRELSPAEVARVNRWATGGLVPHLTVLLDISPEAARERFTEAPDRLESEPAEFHERVRAGFLALAAADPARYLVVDAGRDPGVVTTAVRHRLDQMLPLSEQEIRARDEARRKAEEERKRREAEEAARKAEEERRERERKEQLERLRREEEERKRREIEEARRREEEREAELARQRAEEARKQAEEERKRREAEEAARRAEEERQRRLAEEEARLRLEAQERRKEKQRKAEEALLRAEQERLATESAAAAAAGDAQVSGNDMTQPLPVADEDRAGQAGQAGQGAAAAGQAEDPDLQETHLLPQARPEGAPRTPDADETAVLPEVPDDQDAQETRVLPQVPDPDAEDTQQVPQVQEPRQRSRPEWAEETPLDDLPTLADELLGPRYENEDEDEGDGADVDDRRRGR